jgi:hypothetical protein
MMGAVVLRPARPEDFAELLREPLSYRVRAVTGEKDGRVIGIGGIAWLGQDTYGAFLMLADGAERHRVSLHRAGLFIIAEARKLRLPRLVALADPAIAPAERWLKRLGFTPRPANAGETVWIWTPDGRGGGDG